MPFSFKFRRIPGENPRVKYEAMNIAFDPAVSFQELEDAGVVDVFVRPVTDGIIPGKWYEIKPGVTREQAEAALLQIIRAKKVVAQQQPQVEYESTFDL